MAIFEVVGISLVITSQTEKGILVTYRKRLVYVQIHSQNHRKLRPEALSRSFNQHPNYKCAETEVQKRKVNLKLI